VRTSPHRLPAESNMTVTRGLGFDRLS
jgi:hypothetical protein